MRCLQNEMYEEVTKCKDCQKTTKEERERNRKEQGILRNTPDFISCEKCLKLNVWIDMSINRPKPENSTEMDDNFGLFTILHDFPRQQDLRRKMMDEPEYDELNIERKQNFNYLKYKYEQLCCKPFRPFKPNEPGEVDDDTYLTYDRWFIKILKWLILERKHQLKSKAIFNQEFLNRMIEYRIQKKRLITDKANSTKPEPEEEPEQPQQNHNKNPNTMITNEPKHKISQK